MSDDGEMTVCGYHHNILHGIVKFQKAEHGKMIKEGMNKAVANGKKIGRPTNINEEIITKVKFMREKGIGIKKIATDLSIGVGTVYKVLEHYKVA